MLQTEKAHTMFLSSYHKGSRVTSYHKLSLSYNILHYVIQSVTDRHLVYSVPKGRVQKK